MHFRFSTTFLALCAIFTLCCVFAESSVRRPTLVADESYFLMLFNTKIKLVQFVGIVAGVCVFSATLISIIVLLFKSGSVERFVEEVRSGEPLVLPGQAAKESLKTRPMLYDNLIEASQKLPLNPNMPETTCEKIVLVPFKCGDAAALCEVSDGRAIFSESAYDPATLWMWTTVGTGFPDNYAVLSDNFARLYRVDVPNVQHMVIQDKMLRSPVGMVSIVDNCPHNLSACL